MQLVVLIESIDPWNYLFPEVHKVNLSPFSASLSSPSTLIGATLYSMSCCPCRSSSSSNSWRCRWMVRCTKVDDRVLTWKWLLLSKSTTFCVPILSYPWFHIKESNGKKEKLFRYLTEIFHKTNSINNAILQHCIFLQLQQ